jgi:citrate lyase subunit beta/citryl-CoA lyase
VSPRSWLIVPADDEGQIVRASASGADALIFDLADGVIPERKPQARENLARLLADAPASATPQRWVRINRLDSDFYGADLACCEALDIRGLVLPRAQDGAQVARLSAEILEAGWRIHAIVTETAASLFNLPSFQGSSPLLDAMSWGIDELAVALGASSKFDADGQLSFTYRMARSLCLAGARAAGVQPIDGVFRDLEDAERLQRETEAARREGFTGKLAIDASQVAIINAAFTPTADEIAAARAIVDAFAARPSAGSLPVGSRMVGRARLKQAEAVLDRAAALEAAEAK